MASNYSVPASTRQLLPLDPTRPVPSVSMSCKDVDDDSGDVTAADTDEDEWLCSVFTVVTWLWLYDEFVLPKDLPLRRNITDSVIRDLHVLILFIYSPSSSQSEIAQHASTTACRRRPLLKDQPAAVPK